MGSVTEPANADSAFFDAQSEKWYQRFTALDAVYTELRIAFASGQITMADAPVLYAAFQKAQETRKAEGWEW